MGGPRLAVIVPTRSRPECLRECLRAIAAQHFPPERLEVIVVDDGSPEPVVAAPPVRVVRQHGAGPAAARNAGARATGAERLVFLDDDCLPQPGWLAAMDERLDRDPEVAVGGRLENAFPGNPWAQASQLIVDYFYEVVNRRPEQAGFLGSGHLAVSSEAFRRVGGFDARYPTAAAEDRDFCARWLQSGRRLVYVPEVSVRHAHNLTLWGFVRQHRAYGRGARLLHAQRGGLKTPGFYLGLLSFPFRRYPLVRALQLWPALLLSQVAHTVGYLLDR